MSNESGLEGQVERANAAQQTALAALRAGSSFAKAATEAGVNRATVYRWVQRDPAFRAAYNAWRAELVESARARLLKLAERASIVPFDSSPFDWPLRIWLRLGQE